VDVKFYEIDKIDDSLLKYAVIVARYVDKWIFCENKTRKWDCRVDSGKRMKLSFPLYHPRHFDKAKEFLQPV